MKLEDQPSDYEVDVEQCPHCLGSEGFYYNYTDRATAYYTWDGKIIDTSEPTPVYTGKFRCVSCKRIIEKHVRYTGQE